MVTRETEKASDNILISSSLGFSEAEMELSLCQERYNVSVCFEDVIDVSLGPASIFH